MEDILDQIEPKKGSEERAQSSGSASVNTQANTVPSRKGSENSTYGISSQLSYGKDLWDSLGILTDNTSQRTHQMKSLRTFFAAYKRALDSFSISLQKAITQFEKDFVSQREDHHLHIIDTMSTALVNVKGVMDNIVKSVNEKAEMIHRDLVEPLELYYKHYQSTNQELVKQGTLFWNQFHLERTAMLFAKENYYNQMHTLQQHQLQYQEAAALALGLDPV